jgi:hypothetical protein
VKEGRIITALMGGLVGLALLWVTFAPETVTRAEMQDYVEVTSTEHLRLLRSDLRDMRKALVEVGERLAGVEAILREK